MKDRYVSIAVTCFLAGLIQLPAIGQHRVPILLDTDIGTDIDDAFAVGLALGSHELDVHGITTVGDDTQERAMMMCRLLTATITRFAF